MALVVAQELEALILVALGHLDRVTGVETQTMQQPLTQVLLVVVELALKEQTNQMEALEQMVVQV